MTLLLDVTCRARRHGSDAWTRGRYGCICPTAWGKPYRPVRWRRGPRMIDDPDEVAVLRAVTGDRSLILAGPERDAAIDHLDRYGRSAAQVARLLGISYRTVQRRRARRAQAATARQNAGAR